MSPRAGLDAEAVINAAARIADEDGIESLTMSRLAREVGVRTPSLYNHVDGFYGVYRQLAVRGTRQLAERMGRAAIGKRGDEALLAIAQAYRAFILEHPGMYATTVRSAYLVEPPDPQLEAASREVVEIVLAVLQAYDLDWETALHTVRALRSLAHGFASLELAGGFGMPLDRDESFRFLVQLLINGLAQIERA